MEPTTKTDNGTAAAAWADETSMPEGQSRSGSARATSAGGKADVFSDLSQLRLSQDFGAVVGVQKRLTTVPVRKPNRQAWVRTHPDDGYQLAAAVLELKEEGETYLVDKSLWPDLSTELVAKILITTIDRQGVLSLWPIRLPGDDGRIDEWNRSALEAAQLARDRWIRIQSNRSLGAYEILETTAPLPDPEWPEVSFEEIMRIAFRDRYIQSADHPVLRRLRGEV